MNVIPPAAIAEKVIRYGITIRIISRPENPARITVRKINCESMKMAYNFLFKWGIL